MKTIPILGVFTFLVFAAASSAQEAAASFPKAGFSIKPPDPAIGKAPQLVVMFYLPATDGFSPNVNVIALPAPAGMAGFMEATKKEFEGQKHTLIAQSSPDADTWVYEARGKQEGRELHYYARATLKGSTIYLATATATESQWASIGQQIKASAESLRSK